MRFPFAIAQPLFEVAADPAPAPAAPADPPAPSAPPPAADPPAPVAAVPADPPAPAAAPVAPVADPAPPVPADPSAPVAIALALPANTPLDQTDVDAITAMAQAHGWTQDQAQAALEQTGKALLEQRAAFKEGLDADPEVGGTHNAAAREHAARALDRFLPASEPDGATLRAVMNKSGYGDYAPLVKLLARIGKAMSEDRPIAPALDTPPPARRSHADVLYGKPASS